MKKKWSLFHDYKKSEKYAKLSFLTLCRKKNSKAQSEKFYSFPSWMGDFHVVRTRLIHLKTLVKLVVVVVACKIKKLKKKIANT